MTTRREIIRAGAGLAAILAAGKAPAAFIRSALSARNAMLSEKHGSSPLPPEYQLVEYLRSEGATQHINLSPEINLSTIEFEIVAKINIIANGKFLLGADSGGVRRGGVDCSSGSVRFNGTNVVVMQNPTGIFTVSYLAGNASMIQGSQTTTNSWTWRNLTANVRLCTCSTSSTYHMDCSLYRAKFWENGSLTYNLWPCRRKADDVLGLYNVVNDTLLVNGGTGTFTAGPDAT